MPRRLVVGTLVTIHVQPNFMLNLFPGHLQIMTVKLLTIAISWELASKMA